MTLPDKPRIISAERMAKGLVLRFEDGRCGFYPYELLSKMCDKAKPLDEQNEDW